MQIPSNKGITFSSLPDIDATNPTILYTDTVAGGIEVPGNYRLGAG